MKKRKKTEIDWFQELHLPGEKEAEKITNIVGTPAGKEYRPHFRTNTESLSKIYQKYPVNFEILRRKETLGKIKKLQNQGPTGDPPF